MTQKRRKDNMEEKNTPLVEVRNLKKYFKTKNGILHAVEDVSFTIDEGKTLGIVGESGCGKSTLGKTILRLTEPTSGDVFIEGKNIASLNKRELRKARMNMQMIFQDPYSSLDQRLTVEELIADPLIVNKVYRNKKEIREAVLNIMDTVGLDLRFRDAYPHELDGGRRQRIGIARALVLNPKFIVCDEPVSALDVSIQAQILNLLMDLQEQRKLTYIFVTHDMSVVKHISDDIMVMYLGQCVEKASSDVLFSKPMHPYTKALLSAIPVPKIYEEKHRPTLIKGEVSNPINPKPGCRFASRCDFATEECKGKDIPLIETEKNQLVACHLFSKQKTK